MWNLISNLVVLIKEILEKDKVAEIDVRNKAFPSIKTLGIMWKMQDDIFTLKYDSFSPNNDPHTKRSFFKKLATIFDPLGFLSSFVIQGKILKELQGGLLGRHLNDKIIE